MFFSDEILKNKIIAYDDIINLMKHFDSTYTIPDKIILKILIKFICYECKDQNKSHFMMLMHKLNSHPIKSKIFIRMEKEIDNIILPEGKFFQFFDY